MINVICLQGRIANDLELKKTTSGTSVLSFALAVERNYNREETDFIDCVSWKKTAETMSQYLHKGSMIVVDGTLQTRTYEGKDGKRKVTEVVISNFSFCEKKQDISVDARDIPDDGLPF